MLAPVDKARKLLQLAATAKGPEAETARQRAREIMATHGISDAEVDIRLHRVWVRAYVGAKKDVPGWVLEAATWARRGTTVRTFVGFSQGVPVIGFEGPQVEVAAAVRRFSELTRAVLFEANRTCGKPNVRAYRRYRIAWFNVFCAYAVSMVVEATAKKPARGASRAAAVPGPSQQSQKTVELLKDAVEAARDEGTWDARVFEAVDGFVTRYTTAPKQLDPRRLLAPAAPEVLAAAAEAEAIAAAAAARLRAERGRFAELDLD